MKSIIAVSIAMLMLVTGRSTACQNEPKPPITIALTLETATVKTGAAVSRTDGSDQQFRQRPQSCLFQPAQPSGVRARHGQGILRWLSQWYTSAMPSIESEREDVAKLRHMASEFTEGFNLTVLVLRLPRHDSSRGFKELIYCSTA
jgi:hypothetical protein